MKFKKNNFNILILGSGFVATELSKNLKKLKINHTLLPRKKVDLSKKSSIRLLNKLSNIHTSIFISAAKAPVKDFKMYDYNIKIIKNIIAFFKYNNFKNVVYLSSDAVYSDSLDKLSEKHKTQPKNLHGKMHLKREILLKKSIKDKKKLLILRPTLIYGSNDPHNGYGPNKFIREAKFKKEIILFGKGEEKRDHIFINDLIKSSISLILKKKYGIFNLSTGKVISFLEISKIIQKIDKKNIKIRFRPRHGPIPHLGYRAFNINKLRSVNREIKLQKFDIKIIQKIIRDYRKK